MRIISITGTNWNLHRMFSRLVNFAITTIRFGHLTFANEYINMIIILFGGILCIHTYLSNTNAHRYLSDENVRDIDYSLGTYRQTFDNSICLQAGVETSYSLVVKKIYLPLTKESMQFKT